MNSNVVLREIPERVLQGLASGEYKQYGGVIRDVSGKIVAHLQFQNSEALQSIASSLMNVAGQLNVLQSLQVASIALQGVNLAVTVAGFIIVCRKLDKISQQLLSMDEKLDQILGRINHMEWKRDLERRAYIFANMESLASGLRTRDNAVIADALNRVREGARFFEMFCEETTNDAQIVFLEPLLISQAMFTTTALRLVIAQTQAHRNLMDEAILETNNLQKWHLNQMEFFEGPLKQTPPPSWLGSEAFEKNKSAWVEFFEAQRASKEGVAYAQNQFVLCKDRGMSLDELCSYTSEPQPFACLLAA